MQSHEVMQTASHSVHISQHCVQWMCCFELKRSFVPLIHVHFCEHTLILRQVFLALAFLGEGMLMGLHEKHDPLVRKF
jgi:hypothetical protein